jgi:hypothetical protein
MKTIDIKTSPYFSGQVVFFGIVLVGIGLGFLIIKPVLSGILLFISLIIFTTHYRLRVDLEAKTYFDYLWILGFRNGDTGKFEHLEYIFVKKSKVTQTMSLRVASTTIDKEIYDGYLKFSDQHKIHLVTKDSQQGLLKILAPIAEKLAVKIVDHSGA